MVSKAREMLETRPGLLRCGEGIGRSGAGARVRVLYASMPWLAGISTTNVVLPSAVPNNISLSRVAPPPPLNARQAVRARRFMVSLLDFEGVQEAIDEAGGWGSAERWASALLK